MKKILLIETPEDFSTLKSQLAEMPPMWALTLGTYLKETTPGIKIKIIDGKHSELETIQTKVAGYKPDFVALGPKLQTYLNVLKISRFSKKLGAKVIFGGTHAANLRKEILKNRGKYSNDYCVDVVIQRDGEKALAEYVLGKSHSKINNLVYLDKKGEIKENPVESLNLDSLPIPDRDLVNLRKDYFKKGQPRMVNIYTQKGCNWKATPSGGCLFCSLVDSTVRLRNPEIIWQEIKYLTEKYDAEIIWDGVDRFLNSREWFEEFYQRSFSFFPLRKPKLIICPRTNEINEKIAKMLKKLNIYEVILGLESGCPLTLANLNKGQTIDQHKNALKLLHKHGIKTRHYFVIGAPGETMKTALQTLKYARNLARNKNVSATLMVKLRPYPGSCAWKMLLEKTGNKYKGRDIVSTSDIMEDWLKNFCDITSKDLRALNKIAHSFFFLNALE